MFGVLVAAGFGNGRPRRKDIACGYAGAFGLPFHASLKESAQDAFITECIIDRETTARSPRALDLFFSF